MYGIGTDGVFEPSAIAVNIRKHLTTTRGGHNTPRTSRYTPPLLRYQPQSFTNGESSEVHGPPEIVRRNLHLRKESSSWWKEKPYKRWQSTPKRGLEFNIFKVIICKRQRFNILDNCLVQSFLFPQNLQFLNTFLVFLISLSNTICFRSGDA